VLGSYPVITVLGEGGVGKSALALKVAYDLVDDPSAPFDAVVWVTAKANRLTPYEIQAIDQAVTNSLGAIGAAADYLGRQTPDNPLQDLLLHLKNNRVLLIIDNLETVLDQTIRDLVRSIPTGSKLVFTSRVGLGAFDFPINLGPFPAKEAHHYLRRTCRVWGVNDIAKFPQQKIEDYCKRLQYNPLFIKWFVQGVRAGQRPEAILANPKILLEFCLQNVFEHLSTEAKQVADALLTLGGYQSQPTLTFIADMASDRVQTALTQLLSSNIIISRRSETDDGDDTYSMSPLAQFYLGNYHAPSSDEQEQFIRRRDQLRGTRDELAAAQHQWVYHWNHLVVRSDGDVVAARLLQKALAALSVRNVADAERYVQQAAGLSPNYFEVKRVEAQIAVEQRNYVKAESCYEAAISLAPRHAPLRQWYSGFLSRCLLDTDRAIAQAETALQLDGMSLLPKVEVARLYLHARRFDDAEEQIKMIASAEAGLVSAKLKRQFYDIRLQLSVRRADYFNGIDRCADALRFAEEAKRNFEELPTGVVDLITVRNVLKLGRIMGNLHRTFDSLPEQQRVEAIGNWLTELARARPDAREGERILRVAERTESHSTPNVGELIEIHANYAFVKTSLGNLFFHRGEWKSDSDFAMLPEGTSVMFEEGQNSQGRCAVNVRLEAQSKSIEQLEPRRSGKIRAIHDTYGFIMGDDGGDYFFHINNLMAPTDFETLEPGARVLYEFGYNWKGICADRVKPVNGND
jgi:LuxR family transcriptional regulator, glucitol operon activator